MHFVLLNNPRLAQGPQYLQERLPFLDLELLDRHVGHVDDHDVVAEICLVETYLGQVQLRPRLLHFVHWHLLLLLRNEMLCLAVKSLLDCGQSDLCLDNLLEALGEGLAISQLVPDEIIYHFKSSPVSIIVDLLILFKDFLF